MGHPALLDVLKTLEQKNSKGMECSGWGEGSWKAQEQPVLQTGIKEGEKWSQVLVHCHLRFRILCSE